jgi:hypothetical protein
MPEETYAILSGMVSEMKEVVKVMRNTFYLAVGISPLLLLLPRKLQFDSIRRDVLIAVGFCPYVFVFPDSPHDYSACFGFG